MVGDDRDISGEITLEAFLVAGVISVGASLIGNVTLEPYQVSGDLSPGAELGPYDVQGTLLAGGMLRGQVDLQAFDVASDPGINGSLSLEPFAVSGQLLRGALIQGEVLAPRFTVEGTFARDGELIGDVPSLPFQVNGTLIARRIIQGSVTLPLFTVSGPLLAGRVLLGALELQPYDVTGSVVVHGELRGAVEFPYYTVQGTIEEDVEQITTAFVLNTHTRALSRYANWPFNSMCNFNGAILGAGPDGIVELTGDDDDGAPIEAELEGGVSDLNSERVKHVPYLYTGYRCTGQLAVTITADEIRAHTYYLDPRQDTNLHESRVKLARGEKGMYWQWNIANVDGCGFDLNTMKLVGEETTKSIV